MGRSSESTPSSANNTDPVYPSGANEESRSSPEHLQAVDRMRAVAAAAAGMIGARSYEALLDVLEEACRKVITFDAIFVFGYDAETHSFHEFGGHDVGLSSPQSITPAAGTPGERVVRERRSLLTLRSDHPDARGAQLTGTGRRSESVIRCPIFSGEEVMGILSVQSYTPDAYTTTDVEVVEALASLAATALLNIRLTAEREEAIKTLRARELQLSEAQRLTHLGSWTWVVSDNRVSWSDELYRIYGLDTGTFGESFEAYLALVHPDDRVKVRDHIERTLHTGEPFAFEERIMRPDGTMRILQSSGEAVRDVEGNVIRLIGVCKDITEEQEKEAALHASEESYRTIFELASDAIFVHEIETGAILDANRKACELHGCDLAELKILGIGGISDGRSPFDGPHAKERIQAAARGEPQRFEWVVVQRQTGERFWVEVSLHRVRIRGEDRILASVRNIDERKRAEAALQKTHDELEQRVASRTAELARRTEELTQADQRFRAIVEASPMPLLLSRLDDGVILYANDRLEKLLGYDAGSLIGKKTPDFYFDPADRPGIIETVRNEGDVRDLELCIKKIDSTPRWVSLSVQRLVFNGEPALATALMDITERKQTEKALRVSEETYRSLFDNLTELVYIQDLEGRFLSVNEAVLRTYGYTREELIGQTPELLAAPEHVDMETTMERFQQAVAGKPQRFDWWGRRKDGSIFPKEVVIQRSTYFGQEVVIAVGRDISERVEGEAALRHSEEQFRRLIENASDLISILDAQGVIRYQSPAVTHILGYDPSEMIGKNAFDYMPPEDVAASMERMTQVMAHPGTPVSSEIRFRHKDGSWRYIEAIGATLSADSADEGMVVNSRDITERKNAEAALRLQKTLLEAEGEASIDGILVVSDEGKILSFNQRFVEMWHIPPDVVASRSDEAAIEAVLAQVADPEAFLERIEHLYSNPEERARDEIVLNDGRVFDRYSAPVISSEKEYYGRIWFFRDMTAQKRHAEELELARQEAELARERASRYADSLEQSLEELRAAKDRLVQQEKLVSLGQLTAGIAHEIKNPLNFVTNFAKLNEELIEELIATQQQGGEITDLLSDLQQNSTQIAKHGRRADTIVKNMMQHARGGKGKRQATDLNALVDEYAHLAVHGKQAQTPDFKIDFECKLGENVGEIEIVPQEIGRVLLNLVDNAFDAVHEQAKNVVQPYKPTIKVETSRKDDEIVIRVEDNGPGIPLSVRDRVFEPFFSTKPPGHGTGLGLSLSYDIVTQGHGGVLAFDCDEDRGTIFTVRLPC